MKLLNRARVTQIVRMLTDINLDISLRTRIEFN